MCATGGGGDSGSGSLEGAGVEKAREEKGTSACGRFMSTFTRRPPPTSAVCIHRYSIIRHEIDVCVL
jgi:hypothetical protein